MGGGKRDERRGKGIVIIVVNKSHCATCATICPPSFPRSPCGMDIFTEISTRSFEPGACLPGQARVGRPAEDAGAATRLAARSAAG